MKRDGRISEGSIVEFNENVSHEAIRGRKFIIVGYIKDPAPDTLRAIAVEASCGGIPDHGMFTTLSLGSYLWEKAQLVRRTIDKLIPL